VFDCFDENYELGKTLREGLQLNGSAYQDKTLLKAIDRKLHIIHFEPKTYVDLSHKSKDFGHRITSCCIEPLESDSQGSSSKALIGVALATDDHRFEIAVGALLNTFVPNPGND